MFIRLVPWIVASIVIAIIGYQREKHTKERSEAEKKRRENGSNIYDQYVIQSFRMIFFVMAIGFLFFSACLIGCYYSEQWGWDTGIGFGLVTLFFLIGVMNTGLWKIRVSGDDIVFRNTFGITKHYKFTQITCLVKKKSGATRVYIGGKRIFTFDDNMPSIDFNIQAMNMNIPIRTWTEFKGNNEYNCLIKTPLAERIVMGVSVLIFCAISMAYTYREGVYNPILLVGMFIVILAVLDLFLDRTRICSDIIIRKRLFYKKTIKINSITSAKEKKNLLRHNLQIYVDNKKEFSIWLKNEGIDILKNRLKKEKIPNSH